MVEAIDYAIALVVIAIVTVYAAWREYAGDNRRDAVLLAAFGAGFMFVAGLLAQSNFV